MSLPIIEADEPVGAREISREEILGRLGDPALLLVNALPRESWLDARIPGSISLPVAEVRARARELLGDRGHEIAVYCASPTCTADQQAVRLLRKMGYTNLRIFHGGMTEWVESGGPVERGEAAVAPPVLSQPARAIPAPARHRGIATLRRTGGGIVGVIDTLASRSVGEVLGAWVGMIVVFGLLYWGVEAIAGNGLSEAGKPVPPTWGGIWTALYFSFVTATSVGYGDVVPVGWMRILAILEAASGLLILGFIVSKFLSRRQEEVMDEIHRIAFEDRLDSVQTSLHLVLSDFQQILDDLEGAAAPRPATIARAESAAMVFAGELRAIHGLLYRPQLAPDEDVLEAILANLAAAFTALAEVASRIGQARLRSPVLGSTLQLASRLGSEICGECVPREFAPSLRVWMDRIQQTAGGLAPREAEPS